MRVEVSIIRYLFLLYRQRLNPMQSSSIKQRSAQPSPAFFATSTSKMISVKAGDDLNHRKFNISKRYVLTFVQLVNYKTLN